MTTVNRSTEGRAAVLFCVDPYLDQIRRRAERKWCPIMKRFDGEYFETEAEANAFIIQRAARRIEDAQEKLDRAKARHRKCIKRFK